MQGTHQIGGEDEAAVQDRHDQQVLELLPGDILGKLVNASRDVFGGEDHLYGLGP
jgi:hypothetical protein